MYFDLIDLKYCEARLIVRIAELVLGEPDGCNGTPLVINETSKKFTVVFKDVSDFRSQAEPCFSCDVDSEKLTEFLYECKNSKYLKTACRFGDGPYERARHFYVFTESVVIDVLSESEPRIKEIMNIA